MLTLLQSQSIDLKKSSVTSFIQELIYFIFSLVGGLLLSYARCNTRIHEMFRRFVLGSASIYLSIKIVSKQQRSVPDSVATTIKPYSNTPVIKIFFSFVTFQDQAVYILYQITERFASRRASNKFQCTNKLLQSLFFSVVKIPSRLDDYF